MRSKKEQLIINGIYLICILFLGSLFVFRLFHLQVITGDHYLDLAEENRFYRQKIPAVRGVFLDRYQQPLVFNKKLYYQVEDVNQLFSKKTEVGRDEALRLIASNSAAVTYELRRFYRYPSSLAHIIGYVSPVSADDLLNHEELKPDDWIGKMGLEKHFQEKLHGRDGYKIYEVNTLGEKQRLFKSIETEAGQNVQTSLDPYLAQVAYQALGQNQGVVIMANAANGQILASVSKPSFNANDMSYSLLEDRLERQRQENVQRYFKDERNLFFNRAISGLYPPASIFKLVTAITGLNKEAIDQDTTVLDEGVLKVGDYQYSNWYYTQYGRTEGEIALIQAIARSNDIFFYKVAEWTGPTALAEQARQFGFGQKTGIELPGEAIGLVPDPDWKEKIQGQPWYLGNTYHFGIGQGDMLASPLQIVQLVQALANKGEVCHPRIVNQEEREHCQGLGLSDDHLSLIFQGMLSACKSGGTAYPLFKYSADLQGNIDQLISAGALACKTGTAEFGSADERGYRKTHGWLAAIVGVEEDQLTQDLKVDSIKEKEVKQDSEEENVSENSFKMDGQAAREKWLKLVKENGFPEKLVIVVLIESDEREPFKEGSEHAGPVVATIVDWIRGE
ncbi:MAG: penicillin-binding transpeptidase domain-containing protein [Patescibacteria group bacterium]|nr:penicillin-binding transpeptidase domain-containing protein [Patescibacteria group bacterium]